jgi:hypothetical protein
MTHGEIRDLLIAQREVPFVRPATADLASHAVPLPTPPEPLRYPAINGLTRWWRRRGRPGA